MIYATFIAGSEYGAKYTSQVQKEAENKDVHILTDSPELFPNCKTELYDRKVFSYYDKLTFLVRTVLERKERVTFIDCDWFRGLHLGLELEKDTFYSYAIWSYEDFAHKPFSMEGINMVKEALSRKNFNSYNDIYIGEAILSLPYISNLKNILNDLVELQDVWENVFNQSIDTENPKLKRYASYGVGYGEGGALTAVLQKYGVTLKAASNKKFIHNNLM